MKIPLRWLADYVELPPSLDDLVERLTMSGTEVEDIIVQGEAWQDVIVATVKTVEIPPGSKHLSVVSLDLGSETVLAVTGAPNIASGQKVPVVKLGGTIPRGPDGEPFVLQPRPMMGITGEAMVLSERELGLSEEHSGILVLPDAAVPGQLLADILGEAVLDVDAKGRTDESSVLGVAREVAAVSGAELRQPDTSQDDSVRVVDQPSATVEVLDADLCPRYSAVRIDGITVGPSPHWMSERLEAAGVRSISNIVDVTNFVMLELGQPLHAFDYATIPDGRIIVRRAQPGERIVTLDGSERELDTDMLLITETDGPIGIGGVMGGGKSEVSYSTTSVLLEAANFKRTNIRQTSRKLGLRTEASSRFERGVPPELTVIALARCLHLLSAIHDEPITVYRLTDVVATLPELPTIRFTSSETERLLGIHVDLDQSISILNRLGFTTHRESGAVRATPPYWRRDVEGVADIAEEIARMVGYQTIPETLPGQDTPPVPLPPELRWEGVVRQTLLGIGLSEAWTDTLTSVDALAQLLAAEATRTTAVGEGAPDHTLNWAGIVANPEGVARHGASLEPMPLVNAPTVDRSCLRTSLVPSLIEVVTRNLKHIHERVAFFELARTFFPRPDDLPYERRTLAIALAGDRNPRSWNRPVSQYDFFDLKGIVVALLQRLGYSQSGSIQTFDIRMPADGGLHPALHPGRQAIVVTNGQRAGYLGELQPLVAELFGVELPLRAYVSEIDLDALFANASFQPTFKPVSRFPAVLRDISLTFPMSVAAAAVESLVRDAAGDLLRSWRIIDVYSGEHLASDLKSIALSLEFQSDNTTLTQDSVSEIQDNIVAQLERELGGVLRA